MESFRRLSEILQIGEAAVLATIVETKGSTPREIGAKMIVRRNGEIFGTIGGGAGEAKIIVAAQAVFRTGEKQLIEIDLTTAEAEGVCGGTMRIWLELWRGEKALFFVNQILQNLENQIPVCLVTPLAQDAAPHYLAENEIGAKNAFVETLEPAPLVLIIGAGHVGIELAKLAAAVGFEIAVQDERADWANSKNFPSAKLILNEPVATAINRLRSRKRLFVALLTRGYAYDLSALEAILRESVDCVYLGMIGSRRRVQTVFREMRKRGFSEDELKYIRAPIGLEIGALTPAEIAVSITAELISERRRTREI